MYKHSLITIDFIASVYELFDNPSYIFEFDNMLVSVHQSELDYQYFILCTNISYALLHTFAEHQQQISIDSSTAPVNFVPMKTPILDKDVSSEYSSSNKIQTVIPSLSDIEDEPLQFVKNQSVSVSNNSLNLPYSDSDDENEDDTCSVK